MRNLRILLSGCLLALSGCATLDPLPDTDLIAIGDVRDTEYLESLPFDPNDFLGHGWFEATMTIERVKQGVRPPQNPVTIRYVAHNQRVEGRWEVRLRKSDEGFYFVCARGGVGYICD